MWTLSGFIDEISPDFTEQCTRRLRPRPEVRRGPKRLGHQHPGPRRPSSSPTCRRRSPTTSWTVSSIGSPIGKIFIDEEFGPHLDRMKHAADVAHQLRRAVHPDLLLLPPARRRPRRTTADEVIEPDARAGAAWPRTRTSSCCTRTRRTSTATCPAGAWTSCGRWTRRTCASPGTRPTSSRWASGPTPRATPMLRPHLEYVQIKDALAADGTRGARRPRRRRGGPQTIRALRARRLRRVLLPRTAPGHRDALGRLLRPGAVRARHATPSPSLLETEGIVQ